MSVSSLFIVFLFGVLGSVVQSACGLGYAIIVMALWPMVMPFRTASVLEHIAALVLTIYMMFRFWKDIRWKLVIPSILAGLISMRIGVLFLLDLDTSVLNKILGVTLLVLVLYFTTISKHIHIKPTFLTGFLAGGIAGFSGGLFNIGGPPMAAYFLTVSEDDKNGYVASLQTFFTITGSWAVINHIFEHNLSLGNIPEIIAAILGTIIGMQMGYMLLKRMTMTMVRLFLYTFMTIAGFYLVLS